MLEIRQERFADIQAIQQIHLQSFPTPAEANLVDALRTANHLLVSLIAIVDGKVVGHVAFSPVSAVTGKLGFGLGPVAVLPAHRKKGLAATLINTGIAECKNLGFGWGVVLGNPAYYSRFGFRPASQFGLTDEYEGGDSFQAVELTPGYLPRGVGLVKYAEEFGLFE